MRMGFDYISCCLLLASLTGNICKQWALGFDILVVAVLLLASLTGNICKQWKHTHRQTDRHKLNQNRFHPLALQGWKR